MANISLRAYRREIEELIGQGRIDEVIADCRHILKFYPKDVAIYRLLAKAYLESQRYSDATDIFQRVLSVVPDDFVSHVGMSIIREDEGNLDASIWHMERAFEVQPSNAAIRDELRRLFGKRDGMEPPKIRLTRGALARMYSQGNLFQQSIGELQAALAEDPQRFDLQVLLARMYYMNGQQVEAAETCNSLISKLPFCLDANRILTEILTTSDRAQEADLYHQRVKVIDPYAAHAPANNLLTELISEDTVTLVRLDWEPGQAISELDSQPSWAASLGIELDDLSAGSGLPDWLTDEEDESKLPTESDIAYSSQPYSYKEDPEDRPVPEVEASISTPEPTEASMDFKDTLPPDENPDEEASQEPGELIPEWMKDAGWATSTGEPTEEPPISDEMDPTETQAPQEEGELVSAEIPEWLQDIAPAEAEESSPPVVETDEEMSGEIPSWLSSRPPGPTDSVVMWLKNKPEEDEQPPSTGDLDQPIDLSTGDEVPDWLQSVAGSIEAEAEEADKQPETTPDPGDITEEIPEPFAVEEPPAEAVPETFELESDATVIARPDEVPAEEEPVWEATPSEAPEIPDWEAEVSASPAETIEDTRPRRPAVEEEPADTVISVPPVVETAAEAAEVPETFAAAMDETLPSMEKPIIEEPGRVGMFDDGLEPEEFPAEVEAEEPVPDWLMEMEAEAEAPVAAEEAVPAEEVPDWLQDIEQSTAAAEEEPTAEPELPSAEVESAEEVPDWLQQIEEEATVGGTLELPELQEDFPKPVEESPAPAMEEAVPDWLRGIDAEESPIEAPVAAELDAFPQEPEAVETPEAAKEEGMPEWLLEMEQEAQTVEAPVVSDEAFEFPSEPMRETPSAQVEETPAEALPSWLAEATGSDDATEDEETQPSPIEADALESLPASDAPSLEDTDAAIAWLESLAAKQGAAEEELVMDPEARGESMPEWVTESIGDFEDQEEVPAEAAEVEPVKEAPLPDQPDWMTETLISDTMVPEEEEISAEAAPIEEWSLDTLERTEDEEIEEITPKPLGTRDLELDWIQEEGAEEPVAEASSLEEPLSEFPIADESLPDFMVETAEGEVDLPATLAEELTTEDTPDWLGIEATPEAELEAEPPVPQPAETRELDAEWMRDTGIPEEVISEVPDGEGPEEVEAPLAESLQDTWAAEVLQDKPEGVEAESTEELEPEWMLETALPTEDLEDEEDIFDAETLVAPVPDAFREPMPEEAEVQIGEFADEHAEEPVPAEAVEDDGPDWMLETALPGELEAALAETEDVELETEPEMERTPEPEPVEFTEPEPEPVLYEDPETLTAAPLPPKPDTGLLYGEVLTSAKESLSSGDISEALVGYTRLVRRKRHLDVVIDDLKDALYRHPVDTNILETLGDAYVKSNSLQDALDTYTKAEDLLRS